MSVNLKMNKGDKMDLKEWLFFERRTVTEFAEMLDYSRTHLSGIVNGKNTPSRKLIKRIERVTNGQVTRDDYKKYKKEPIQEG
jgi:transcriptional regulator with XRE-family HTH domain